MTAAIRPLKSAAAPPLLKRQLTFLAAALFIVSLGYGALMPVLPTWLAQFPGSPDAADIARQVGFLSGAYAAGVLIGAPLWGYVSDRIGRRRILIFGMVGFVASLLLLLVAPSWGSLWVIYALRTAAGLCVAAVIPVVPAIVAEHTPEEQRARRFAWLGATSLVGFLFGPALYALALSLAKWFEGSSTVASTDLVILMSAVLGAAIMLGLAWTLPARPASEISADTVATTDRAMNVVALFGLSGVAMFVLSGFEVGIILQGQQHAGLTTQQISLMFAECSLAMLAVNALLFFTSLLEKVPSRVLVVAGMLLSLAGLAILAVHEETGWMYLGVSLTGAGIGLVLPVIAYLAAGVSPRHLGATMGGITAAAGLGQVLGSSAGGWLFGELAQTSYGWLSLPLIFTLVVLWLRPKWGLSQPSVRESRPRGAAGNELSMANMRFLINGRSFRMDEISFEVKRGAVEVWSISNPTLGMPHPMHIHGFSFQVVERLNSPPQVSANARFGRGRTVSDLGWKDTVLVWPGETVKIAVDFTHDFTGSQTYLLHCHNLEHEDAGMMVNFRVNA